MRYVVRPVSDREGTLEGHPDDSYAVSLAASGEPEHAGWRFATAQEVDAMVEAGCAQLRADAAHHKAMLSEGR